LNVELHLTADNKIRLVLIGDDYGELYFHDFNAFAAFIEQCHDFIKGYKTWAEAYTDTLITEITEIPIPEAFLEAFDD
jgi:hypothetical protein